MRILEGEWRFLGDRGLVGWRDEQLLLLDNPQTLPHPSVDWESFDHIYSGKCPPDWLPSLCGRWVAVPTEHLGARCKNDTLGLWRSRTAAAPRRGWNAMAGSSSCRRVSVRAVVGCGDRLARPRYRSPLVWKKASGSQVHGSPIGLLKKKDTDRWAWHTPEEAEETLA